MSVRISNVRGLAALIFGIAVLTGPLQSAAMAKSYRITGVDVVAHLRPDGSMDVSEKRTYRFSGSFSFAYRDLPAGEPVVFEAFEVYENGRPYQVSGSEAPGTYRIRTDSGKTRVTWYYRASDESRTFEFRYRARNAVKVYEDAAVLYYKFLSEDWDQSQNNVSLTVSPPGSISRGEVSEWLHGPLWAESRITDDGVIVAQCSHLPARRYLEVRALYPPRLFPEAQTRAGAVRLEIMAEEAAWAGEANSLREAARGSAAAREKRLAMGKWLVLTIGLGGLAGWWQLYRKYGRRPALPQFLSITSEVPGKTPPALVGYLLHNRQVSGRDVAATMLDLARRGFVELREEVVEKKGLWGGTKVESEYYWDLKRDYLDRHASDLLGFEHSLLRFIFGELAEGKDSIRLDSVGKKRREFIRFFGDWKKDVSETGDKRDWFDTASFRGTYYSLALGGTMLALTIGAVFLFEVWAVILGAASIAVIVLSFTIYHRTAQGETEARHWKALQKYLKNYEFRSQDHRDLLLKISDYLVYGVVLGLSTKFYREIAGVIPEGRYPGYVPWYIYHGAGGQGFSPAAFGEAFSSMVATTASTMSTAAGTGGGASAGGGGGASSGGGGAG